MPVDLFSTFQLGGLALANRIVMAPMTRNRTAPGNLPTALNATYYAQRASAGLIVSEATHISAKSAWSLSSAGIWNAAQTAAWAPVVQAVHEAGGRIFLQLWHVGRVAHAGEDGPPVAPSALAARLERRDLAGAMRPLPVPRALSAQEIAAEVERYGQAAANARAAGFDGVEIHAANGFLIDQFLRDGSNRRGDRYGGSPAGRIRFLLEVTEAATAVWGAGRVGVRISPTSPFNDMADGDPAATYGAAVDALNGLEPAYLHVVEGLPGHLMAPPEGSGRLLPLLRRRFRGPLIANGGYARPSGDAAVADGTADLVSFAALFLANPDLPERLRRGGPFNPPDAATYAAGGEKGYTDYPFLAA